MYVYNMVDGNIGMASLFEKKNKFWPQREIRKSWFREVSTGLFIRRPFMTVYKMRTMQLH